MSAADWNLQTIEQAKKEGVKPEDLRILTVEETAAAKPAEQKEVTVFTRTVEIAGKSMTFESDSAEGVLDQVVAAQNAAAPKPEVKKVEPPKELSQDEKFKIGQDLMTGDATAIDRYLLGSGLLDRYLEAKGINPEAIKKATATISDQEVVGKWNAATAEFMADVKAGTIDYPQCPQNTELMGIAISQLGLQPSKESMVKAFEHLKSKNLLFPAATAATETVKKKAASSTAFGASAGAREAAAKTTEKPMTKAEFAKMTPVEVQAYANRLKQSGVNPDTVVLQ